MAQQDIRRLQRVDPWVIEANVRHHEIDSKYEWILKV